jgi:ketosteroid isomerase-like protein
MAPIEIIRTALSNLASRRIEAFCASMREDAVMDLPFMNMRLVGRSAWEPVLTAFLVSEMKSFEWLDVELFEGTDAGLVFGKGRSRGISKDDRLYENDYAWFFWLKDGKIHYYTEYLNPLKLHEFMESAPAVAED